MIRRYIRYTNHEGAYSSIALPSLQKDKSGSKTTLWLRNDLDIVEPEESSREMVGFSYDQAEESASVIDSSSERE